MRTIACIVAPFALVAAAACNTPSTGDQRLLEFTPVNCGNPLLGCELASPGIAAGGAIDLEVRGVDGVSTDGITLVSANPAVIAVTEVAGRTVPTWELRGVAAGATPVRALDAGGAEVDAITIAVAASDRLGLVKIAGTATGPTDETPFDEVWEVTAGGLVSFQAVPMKGDDRQIGRLTYDIMVPDGSTLLDSEQSTSDREAGYLYIQPAAGDYSFMVSSGALSILVALHAR